MPLVQNLGWSVRSLLVLGKSDRAADLAKKMFAPSDEIGDHFSLAGVRWINGVVARLKGEWAAARDFIDEALTCNPLDRRCLSTRAVLEHEVGDNHLGQEYLDLLLTEDRQRPSSDRHPAYAVPLIARYTGELEHISRAETVANSVLSRAHPPAMTANLATVGLG